jgi:transposase
MYIRKTQKVVKEKTYVNYLLVESVMTAKGPRQKTICSLGNLEPRPREEWLRLVNKVEEALVGQEDLFEPPDEEVRGIVQKIQERRARPKSAEEKDPSWVRVNTEEVAIEEVREAGPVHVGLAYWRRLGMEEILTDVGMNERVRHLTCAMTLNRLIHPSSEHAMPRWIDSTALGDLLGEDITGLQDDTLYRNLDRLHGNREQIETGIFERACSLFNLDRTIYLYDLTSTYFEGEARKNDKAKRGYSRDKRPDCKQVIVGLVVNREGFPVAHEVFGGNVQDRQTLSEMLTVLDKRVGLKEGQTVVIDRGMAYTENVEELRRRKLHYIVAARQSERDECFEEMEKSDEFTELERPASSRKPPVRVKVGPVQPNGERTVLCYSEHRADKERAIRTTQEKRFIESLERLQKSVRKGRVKQAGVINQRLGRLKERYPRVARYYEVCYDPDTGRLTWNQDEKKMDRATTLDGKYILKTDRNDLTPEEVWHTYMLLTRAEEAFRTMKSPLAERPIFHQLEHRVETHIFLCVLAYHLLVAIEKTLEDQGLHTSWATVREILSTHQVCTVVLPTDQGATLRIRRASTPEEEHLTLYHLLNVPSEIMRPKRIWSEGDP